MSVQNVVDILGNESLSKRVDDLSNKFDAFLARFEALAMVRPVEDDGVSSVAEPVEVAETKVAREARSSGFNIRRMIKDLKIDDPFAPNSEQEYDDVLTGWQRIAAAQGYDVEDLKAVVVRVAKPHIVAVTEKIKVSEVTFSQFRDELARLLYPFSNEVEFTEEQIRKEDRGEGLTATIFEFQELVARHQMLCKRWKVPCAFTEFGLNRCLLLKLPLDLVEGIMANEHWRELALDDLIRLAHSVQDSRQRRQRMTDRARSTLFAAAAEQSTVAPQSVRRKCYSCGEEGHMARECDKRKKCSNCGRWGHSAGECVKLEQDTKTLGAKRTVTFRKQGNSIVINVEDFKNQPELLKALGKHFDQRADRSKKLYEEAASKRASARAERLAERRRLDSGLEDGEIEVILESDQDMDTGDDLVGVSLGEYSPSGRYITVHIAGLPVRLLVDTGADCNLMALDTYGNIRSRVLTKIEEPCTQKPIVGVGGEAKILFKVVLPLVTPIGDSEAVFYVVEKLPVNILGREWMKSMKVKIDLAAQTIEGIGGGPIALEDKTTDNFAFAVLQQAEEVFTEEDIMKRMDPELDEAKKQNVMNLLKKYDKTWSKTRVGACNIIEHAINTGSSKPIQQSARRYSPDQRAEIIRQTDDLLAVGAIEESFSPWRSQIVMVPKKGGEWRMCCDFRGLNDKTVFDAFPIPHVTELIDGLSEARYFVSLDLKAGYHQIPVRESDREKTAFATPGGLYQWKVMPFGLVNAGATFQRAVSKTLKELLFAGVLVYIDDIVIYAATWLELMELFEAVLVRLEKSGLFLNIRKSSFGMKSITYLGMEVGGGCIRGNFRAIQAVKALLKPVDVDSLRRFLGLTGYFRQFIRNYSGIVAPLFRLLKKNVIWDWTPECDAAIETLKKLLTDEPIVLALPQKGWKYLLDTDASTIAIGAVLQQIDPDGNTHVIRYASKRLSDAEKKWPVYELEAYAIVWAVTHLSCYLYDQMTLIRTDHKSLKWLWNTSKSRVARWALALQNYALEIQYRSGSAQSHVDILTRDVSFTELDEVLDDKIGARNQVFSAVSEDELEVFEKDSDGFPTVEEFEKRLSKEDVPEYLVKSDNLWVNRHNKIYVPNALRFRVWKFFHYGKVGVHQGIQRTYRRIKQYFFWEKMLESLKNYHAMCLTCLRRSTLRNIVGPGNLLASDVFQVVAMDTFGPIWHQKRLCKLLTVIDHFSKYPKVFILEHDTALEVWNLFSWNWLSEFGLPDVVLTDEGSQFMSPTFRGNLEASGIKHKTTGTYYPDGNAVIEAFHVYLKRGLSSISALHDWDLREIISAILFAFRSTPHPSTGDTPFRIVFGFDMPIPHWREWYSEMGLKSIDNVERYRIIDMIRRNALDELIRHQVLVEAGQPKLKPSDFNIGDWVLYTLSSSELTELRRHYGTSKLMPSWSEPCRIVDFTSDARTSVKLSSPWHGPKHRIVHVSELKKLQVKLPRKLKAEVKKEIESDRIMRHIPQTRGALAKDYKRARPDNSGDDYVE